MAETLMKIILGAMLLVCGIQDFKKKKIYLWGIALGGFLTGLCIPFSRSYSAFDILGGIAVGICVVMISIVTGGKIGLGDGLILCVTGLCLGFWGNLELFAAALMMAAGVSIILLIFRHADRKKSIPFVPFMFLGYLFVIISGTGIMA